MFFCYSDSAEPFTGSITKLDPNKCFMKHYGNSLYLNFIFNSSTDGVERRQANKEIQMADKKMAYWRKHPDFSLAIVEPKMKAEKAKWRTT